MKVLQSKDTIMLNEGFTAHIITVERPRGGGWRKILIPELDQLKKNSIATVSLDEQQLCCAKAILLAKPFCRQDPELKCLKDQRNTLLSRRAMALHSKTGVPEGSCGVEQIKIFEKQRKVQVVVISTETLNKVRPF